MSKEKIKVAIFFMHDEGEYYIENAALFTGGEVPKTAYKHEPVMVIDETAHWENYKKTKSELSRPTTKGNDVIAVIQYVEDCR